VTVTYRGGARGVVERIRRRPFIAVDPVLRRLPVAEAVEVEVLLRVATLSLQRGRDNAVHHLHGLVLPEEDLLRRAGPGVALGPHGQDDVRGERLAGADLAGHLERDLHGDQVAGAAVPVRRPGVGAADEVLVLHVHEALRRPDRRHVRRVDAPLHGQVLVADQVAPGHLGALPRPREPLHRPGVHRPEHLRVPPLGVAVRQHVQGWLVPLVVVVVCSAGVCGGGGWLLLGLGGAEDPGDALQLQQRVVLPVRRLPAEHLPQLGRLPPPLLEVLEDVVRRRPVQPAVQVVPWLPGTLDVALRRRSRWRSIVMETPSIQSAAG
jgi:hypothetical protein